MQKITTCLWFDDEAEEAMNFYVSVLGGDSKITGVVRNSEAAPGPTGAVLTVTGQLAGHQVMALNGRPGDFAFNESVSLSVDCDDQEEVDRLWSAFTVDGGQESLCGWVKDKYGLSWQITPRQLHELLGDPDPGVANRVMEAMRQMRKIELSEVLAAAKG